MTNPWSYFFLKKNYYFMKYGIIFIFALSFTVNGFSQNYAGEFLRYSVGPSYQHLDLPSKETIVLSMGAHGNLSMTKKLMLNVRFDIGLANEIGSYTFEDPILDTTFNVDGDMKLWGMTFGAIYYLRDPLKSSPIFHLGMGRLSRFFEFDDINVSQIGFATPTNIRGSSLIFDVGVGYNHPINEMFSVSATFNYQRSLTNKLRPSFELPLEEFPSFAQNILSADIGAFL
jgi:hypothetical protein